MLPMEITYCPSPYEAAEDADVLVVITEWEQFRTLDLWRLKRVMRTPIVLDLRAVYSAEMMTLAGFRYYRLGAAHLVPSTPALSRPIPPIRRLRVNGSGSHGNGASRKPKPQRQISATTNERAPA